MFLLGLIRKGSLNSVTFNEDNEKSSASLFLSSRKVPTYSNQEEALRDEPQNRVPRVSRFNDSKPLRKTKYYVMKEQREKKQIKKYQFFSNTRLVPCRYLSVFWDERRLGIRLRRARRLMGREEGKIATGRFRSLETCKCS